MKRTLLVLTIVIILGIVYTVLPLDSKVSLFEPSFEEIFYKVYKDNQLEDYPLIYVSSPEITKMDLPQNVKLVNPNDKEYPYLAIDNLSGKGFTSYTFLLEKEKEPLLPLPLASIEVRNLPFGWEVSKDTIRLE